MTVHIAFAGVDSGVLVSDSQSSTESSKIGGTQKQFVGSDFALGGAGSNAITGAMMDDLCRLAPPISSDTLCSEVENFLRTSVVPSQHASVGFIALLSKPTVAIKAFRPYSFVSFREEVGFSSIGSGSEFVRNAAMCGASKWMVGPTNDLVQQLLQSIYYADAANESLTVNNDIMASFIKDQKAYVLADEKINPTYMLRNVYTSWSEVTSRSAAIFAMARTCVAEVQHATSVFSRIWSGSLDPGHFGEISQHNSEVFRQINLLATEIDNYRVWYDSLLAR